MNRNAESFAGSKEGQRFDIGSGGRRFTGNHPYRDCRQPLRRSRCQGIIGHLDGQQYTSARCIGSGAGSRQGRGRQRSRPFANEGLDAGNDGHAKFSDTIMRPQARIAQSLGRTPKPDLLLLRQGNRIVEIPPSEFNLLAKFRRD